MLKLWFLPAMKFMLFFLFLSATGLFAQYPAGLQTYSEEITDGHILFAPLRSTNTYLIDQFGRVVFQWEGERPPGNEVELLPDGTLLRSEVAENIVLESGGAGGLVKIYDQDSRVLWNFTVNNDTIVQHHDVSYLPNGNILIMAWRWHSTADAIEAGRNPALTPESGLWSEVILEVRPILPDDGEIVWEWDSWDHYIQDMDNSKGNFGNISEHPELIDINFNASADEEDWIHANGFDYHPELDQLIISSRSFSEVWIIDHSTSTQQASGHSGGNLGKGGDLVYRWGNPASYRPSGAQRLFNQHNPTWIRVGDFYSNGLVIFNNNNFSDGAFFSTVDVIEPTFTGNGYELSEGEFLPESASYKYMNEGFISRFISGAQVLPSGHILICSGAQGHFFEIDPITNEVLWSYINPVTLSGIVNRDFTVLDPDDVVQNTVFRAHWYSPDDPAITSLDLSISEPIEGQPWNPVIPAIITATDVLEEKKFRFYPNPSDGMVTIEFAQTTSLVIRIISLQGVILREFNLQSKTRINLSDLPRGTYILNCEKGNQLIQLN